MAQKFWGNVFSIAGGIAAVPVAIAKGGYDALNGGNFEKGFESVIEPVVNKMGDFGDRHHANINTGVTVTIIGLIGKEFEHVHNHNKPSQLPPPRQ